MVSSTMTAVHWGLCHITGNSLDLEDKDVKSNLSLNYSLSQTYTTYCSHYVYGIG
jgi:hypothetical protein